MPITIDVRKRKLESMKGQMGLDMFLRDVLKIKNLRPSSNNYLGLCPFHDDSHRSFGVSIHYPHAWGCMLPSCQRGRELSTLVMRLYECSYEQAQEIIETYMGYIKKVSEMTLDIPYYDEEEEKFISDDLLIEYSCGYRSHPYFYKRGLTKEMEKKFQVGFDRYRRRIVFPIFQDGELINFVGRTVDPDVEPKYLIYEDVDRDTFMFGEHVLPERIPFLILYEGLLETVYSHQIGYPNCLSLLGAYITKYHVERMMRYTDKFLLFQDNDDAGRATTEKALWLIKKAGGHAVPVRHLTEDKKVKKDLLDYKSRQTIRAMIKVAANKLFAC
jgi:DNA primase